MVRGYRGEAHQYQDRTQGPGHSQTYSARTHGPRCILLERKYVSVRNNTWAVVTGHTLALAVHVGFVSGAHACWVAVQDGVTRVQTLIVTIRVVRAAMETGIKHTSASANSCNKTTLGHK